ncbi:alkaline phosphatase family protein [Solitalea sp. MAHUQ-68]|uniref:Alkaline phosphatase family protein n=1 Tax=Solitalea agri TaxID=2953739 RepID=A0A9X2F3C6_9SPHI|nr:alkaline phosphatase PafA [Solitalea agri]MCO4291616.1 alkaline phosphatase family protein [Solitalea agri]
MKKYLTLTIVLLLMSFVNLFAQKSSNATPEKPKLVVGIVVDQMRYDYLYRYINKYSEGGFKRLMKEGFNCKNNHYSYVPTYTGPGHASVYTGSVPSINGIAGNDWYDRYSKKSVYCAEDTSVVTVGSNSKAGLMSPKNLLVTTITDQLRLSNNFGSRVIGVSQKDRGSILPAGHTANASYWFDSSSGNWITSSFYMNELPKWVQIINEKRPADEFLKQSWTTLLPIEQYSESTSDDQPFERALPGEEKPVFPHKAANYEVLRTTPWGNAITKNFAIEILKNEQLGKGKFTDFLAVSFSSTDYVGHSFGPNSIEAEDTYLRLDKDIAELLSYLDSYLGKENVLVFLTADHGVANVAAYNTSVKIPAGLTDDRKAIKALGTFLNEKLGDGKWIEYAINDQLYLNTNLLKEKNVAYETVFSLTKEFLMQLDGVANVIDIHNLSDALVTDYQLTMIRNGMNAKRSGDIYVLERPNWMSGSKIQGTTHGSIYNNDTHVPLLWYGWSILPKSTIQRTQIVDISATLAALLEIQEPNGCVGIPIQGLTK